MAIVDYSNYIQDVIEPKINDTVFNRMVEDLQKIFTLGTPRDGSKITEVIRTSWSSNVANFTAASSTDPASSTQTLVQATWDKTYTHGVVEVPRIKINESKDSGLDLVADAIAQEAKALSNKLFVNCITQIKADIDSTATYSDAALDRSTYPTLASYEEDTDTPITLDIMRAMINGVTLLKNTGPLSGYVGLVEQAVYNKLKPLAAALNTWNVNDSSKPNVLGYTEMGNFEGLDIVVPVGLTTGDVFMIRKEDAIFLPHRAFEVEQVASGNDNVKFKLTAGLNAYVKNPGFQGKMTDKD